MRRILTSKISWGILAIAIAGVLTAGLVYKLSPKKPVLKEVQVKRRDLKMVIQSTGDVEALNKVDILPTVAGRVEKILVEEGQSVKKKSGAGVDEFHEPRGAVGSGHRQEPRGVQAVGGKL